MKGYLGISLTFLLGCQILETSSRVVQSFDGQIRLDQEREQRLVSENDVIDFTDVGKYCKFLLIKDEKGERNILYACPKRPGFKYNPHEEEEVSSLLLQHGSRSKDKATAEKFKCPFPWGTFPHPKDCSKYYLCLFMKPREMTCKISEFYDVEKEKCHKKDTVDCGERSGDGKEKDDDDEKDDDKDEIFKCPYPWGTYPHRKDCSKYYLCLSRNPYTMTCPKEKLYDIYSRECQKEDEVDCGSRYNPREKSTTSQELEASTTLEYGTTAENPLVSSTIVEATSTTILITRDSTEGQKSLEPNTQTNRVSTDDSTAMEVTPSQVSSMNTDYYTESENLGSREHTGGTGSNGIRTTDVETDSETISKYSTRSDVYTNTPQSEEDTPSTYDPSRDTQITTRDDSSRTEKLASDTPDLLTSSTSSDIGVSTKTTEQEEEERKTAEVTSEHFSIKTTFDGSSSSIPEERTTEKVTEFVTEETFTPKPERVTLSTTFKITDTTEKESNDLSESTSNVFTHSKGTSENKVRDLTTLDTRGSFSWTTAGEDEEEATTNNPWTDRPDPGSFICPRKSGNFPHDSDCSTYFACRGGKSSVEKCTRGTLFHISFSICYAEDKVDCGSRKRPVIDGKETNHPKISFESTTDDPLRYSSGNTFEYTTDHTTEEVKIVSIPYDYTNTESPISHETSHNPSHETQDTTSSPTRRRIGYSSTGALATTSAEMDDEGTSQGLKTDGFHPTNITGTKIEEDVEKKEASQTYRTPNSDETIITITEAVVSETSTVKAKTPCISGDDTCFIDDNGNVFRCPESNGLFPHATNLHKFLHCHNFKIHIMECANQLVFDPTHKVCVWPK